MTSENSCYIGYIVTCPVKLKLLEKAVKWNETSMYKWINHDQSAQQQGAIYKLDSEGI